MRPSGAGLRGFKSHPRATTLGKNRFHYSVSLRSRFFLFHKWLQSEGHLIERLLGLLWLSQQ